MLALVTTLQLQPGTLDEFLRRFQDMIAPTAAAQPGFGGSILLIDPPLGKVLAVDFWETEADLPASVSGAAVEPPGRVSSLLVTPPAREVYEVSVQVELTEQGVPHMRGI